MTPTKAWEVVPCLPADRCAVCGYTIGPGNPAPYLLRSIATGALVCGRCINTDRGRRLERRAATS